ncbi:hypothetical protein DFH08DRAFT_701525 [Mycena albidolilacea]|uniref:Uncharacterized protein n=1 Tax=Mycena albidolilacea TaxID=1033008 RepID=A0AAD7EQA0_9AGAR|nr:hypothetical protein DFH08DRAFT_701525 [Mycena albidolilacea]
MPRKKPATAIRNHYSKDLKERVIYQAYTLGHDSKDIAHALNMPLRVVQPVKEMWAEIGEVCRDRRHKGRALLMSPNYCKFVLALLDHTPDMFLDEIQEALFIQHDIDVSLATICRTFRRLGISSKRASAERCAHARRDFLMEIGDEPADRIVCADESADNILTSYRRNGWSMRGLRACKRCRFV